MGDTVPLGFEFDAHFQKLFRSMTTLESKIANDLKRINGTFEASNRKVSASLDRSAQAMAGFGKLTGSQRFVLQNTTAQFGDLAVMIAAGTDPMRAMGQQIPQLLGGFAALGGTLGVVVPILGTLAAIGLPLASFFIGMAAGSKEAADKAETLADKTKLLEQATADYMKAAENSKVAVGELRDEYGTLADEVKRALDIQTQLNLNAQRGAQALTAGGVLQAISGGAPELGSADAIKAVLNGYDALIAKRDQLLKEFTSPSGAESADNGVGLFAELSRTEAQIGTLDRIRQRLVDLATQYGITAEQAGQLVAAAAELNSADPGRAQVEAADRLNALMIAIFGSASAVEEKFAGVQAALAQIVQDGAKVAQVTDDAGLFAVAFGDAIDRASALLDGVAAKYGPIIANIQAAATAAWDWAAATAAAVSRAQEGGLADAAGNPTGFGTGTAARRPPPRAPFEAPLRTSGGGSVVDKQHLADLAASKSLYESTMTAAEKYAAELQKINDLKEKGLISDETYRRGIEKLKNSLQSIDGIGKQVTGALKSAFDGLFDDPQAALEKLGNTLLQLALYQQLAGSFPSVFGGGGLIPLIPGFASGGRHSGGLRIVGENGPELEATGPSMIFPTDFLKRASGGGAPVVYIENNTGQAARTETARGPNGEQAVRAIIGEQIVRGGLDKPMRGRFGAQPFPVRR